MKTEELLQEIVRLWEPPPELTLSQWADRERHLSPESAAEHGKWTTLPYQVEPLDAVSDPRIRRVVIKSATQMLKSVTIENAIGYFASQDPGPILLLQPGDSDAKDFSKERIAPMIRDTPCLRKIFSESKRANSESTITEKLFPGGMLAIAGAGSVRNLARRSIRFLFCDEVDKYKPTAEGNAISLARKRLVTFRHRAKEIDTCSPTFPGSEIDRAYEASDQREFYVPCGECGAWQSLMRKWHRVRWDEKAETDEARAKSARYHCEACDAGWNDAQRHLAVTRGKWRAHKPFAGTAGFWISELYSPWKNLWEIVMDYLSKKDDVSDLQTFVNTSLAENWVDKGEAPEYELLLQRREDYQIGIVPKGGLFLTTGVDVQREAGGRLELETVAWGRNWESWSVDYQIFEGNPAEREVWDRLEAYRRQTFLSESGVEMPISRMFVDSGDGTVTNYVYAWVRDQDRRQVAAIKGQQKSDLPVGQPRPVDVTVGGHKIKGGLNLRNVWVDFFKAALYADLKKRAPTEDELAAGWTYPPGYCHFPRGRNYGDEHFKQLCAEQLVTTKTKTGRVKREWQQTRARNEALDCRIYARAAAWDVGMDRFQERHWRGLEAQHRAHAAEPKPIIRSEPVETAPPPPAVPPPPSPQMPRPSRPSFSSRIVGRFSR